MAALKEEVETLKSSLQGEKEGKEQSQKEADDVKSQLAELQAAEKSVRHDLEQALKAVSLHMRRGRGGGGRGGGRGGEGR